METSKADLLRKEICDLLTTEKLDEIAARLLFLLDERMAKQYPSMQNRITQMSHPGTLAGNLEISTASFLMKTQIHVHQQDNNSLKLVAKIPANRYKDAPPIRVLNHVDDHRQAVYFDLLVPNSGYTSARSLSVSIHDIIQMRSNGNLDKQGCVGSIF